MNEGSERPQIYTVQWGSLNDYFNIKQYKEKQTTRFLALRANEHVIIDITVQDL
jgi:hypothetical protein